MNAIALQPANVLMARAGYNSVHDVESLIDKFLKTPVFE